MFLAPTLLAAALLPQAPDPTLPPAGVRPAATAEARGVQIYICIPQGGSFQWFFKESEAVLFDRSTRKQVGTESAGPAWAWSDGSTIQGKALREQPAPDPKTAIPSLLFETQPTGTATGVLTGVTFVRRFNTQAGTAPTSGCDAQSIGTSLRVPFGATYTFYKKVQ